MKASCIWSVSYSLVNFSHLSKSYYYMFFYSLCNMYKMLLLNFVISCHSYQSCASQDYIIILCSYISLIFISDFPVVQ